MQPVSVALDTARAAAAGLDPVPATLPEMARRFAATEFDVPDDSDADGLLFQYGPASWFPAPTFVLSLGRQLEVSDADGEHDHYEQIHFEFRYDLTPDLADAGRHTEWWFPGGDITLADWLAAVGRTPAMALAGTHSPREFTIYRDRP